MKDHNYIILRYVILNADWILNTKYWGGMDFGPKFSFSLRQKRDDQLEQTLLVG